MRIEVVTHGSGEQLPIFLDGDGLPIVLPNEFMLSRRYLSSNTLVRNLRELAVLYRWLENNQFDLSRRLQDQYSFSEAGLVGGLMESLRRKQGSDGKGAVSPNTFNQRLTTVRQFIGWHLDVLCSQHAMSSDEYEHLRQRKRYILESLDRSFMSTPPEKRRIKKGLNDEEVAKLLAVLDPNSMDSFGSNLAVKFRNYVSVGLMLFCGLRPGELLSLKVEDVQFGAISGVKVERRPPDAFDRRRPRPQVKRNGRVIPLDNRQFSFALNEYIVKWREDLEVYADCGSEYLILSDEGFPLSQSSITQFFQLLRAQFAGHLPVNLTAKSLRHTFSSRLERTLRLAGMDEQRRREALAMLRGDSSLKSQDVYIAQEVEEQAILLLKKYQQGLIPGSLR